MPKKMQDSENTYEKVWEERPPLPKKRKVKEPDLEEFISKYTDKLTDA